MCAEHRHQPSAAGAHVLEVLYRCMLVMSVRTLRRGHPIQLRVSRHVVDTQSNIHYVVM